LQKLDEFIWRSEAFAELLRCTVSCGLVSTIGRPICRVWELSLTSENK